MIKKFTLSLLLLICIDTCLLAQNNLSIVGKVSLNNDVIANWPVYLLNSKDSVLVKTTITKEDGSFIFNDVKDGGYFISISTISSKSKLFYPININNKNTDLGNLNFRNEDLTLREVKVTSNKPYLTSKNGKTIIELENSPFGLGSTGFEIIQTLPGIRLRNDNEISVNGKNNIALYIDDRPSNLTGENLIDYLRNLNTSNIEKIEIIDVLNAKYDAANNGGVINIKFKKGKNIGSNGTFNLGGGLGINYRYNAGLNYNLRTKKSNLFLNYDFNKIKASDQINLSRDFNNSLLNFNIENNDIKNRENHTVILGYNYNIDSLQTVGVLINTFSNEFISDERNISKITNNNSLDSTINTISSENRKIYNFSGNLNYKRSFANSKSKLSSDLDFLNFDRKSQEYLNSSYRDGFNQIYKSPLAFTNFTPAIIKILTSKIDYSTVFKNNTELFFGIKASFVNTISDRLTNIVSGNDYILNPSAKFNYNEQVYAGYASIKHQITKDKILELGLRAEQTLARGDTTILSRLIDRVYLNLFPSISFQNVINANHTLNLSLNKGIVRPRYEELNPFFYFLDQYTYRRGNTTLNPSFIYAGKLEWLFKDNYSTTIKYNYNKGFAYNIYEQNDVERTAITYFQNFDYRQTVGLSLNIPITISKWYNLNLYTEGNLEYFKFTNQQNQIVYNQSGNYAFIITSNLTLPKNIRASINYNYESPTAYGIYSFKALYYANMAFSKPMFKNKGSLRLIITDPLNTNAGRYASNFYNLDLTGREKAETRSFRLNFSYKFGKTSVKNYERRKLGSDDEKSRVGL
jgi:iron complex outermembrane receptor protein